MHLAKATNFTQAKVWKTNPKKTHWKNEGAKKSVEKMQAKGKTCFLCNTGNNTTHPKLRKHEPKIQPQMKHTNTTTAPKNNPTPRDDDTRLLPPHPYRRVPPPTPCKVAKQKWPMEATNTLPRTRQMQPRSMNENPNPEIWKAVNEIALWGRRNDAWQRSQAWERTMERNARSQWQHTAKQRDASREP